MILSLAVVTGLISLYLLLSSIQPLTEGSVITADEWQRLEDETLALIQRRDRVFAEIRELNFESALNKVDARDFKTLKRQYEDEAIAIMDELQSAFDAYGTRIDSDMEAVILAARERRAGKQTAVTVTPEVAEPSVDTPQNEAKLASLQTPDEQKRTCIACDAELPEDAKFCDRCGQVQTIECGACGKANRGDARFCKNCGEAMETPS